MTNTRLGLEILAATVLLAGVYLVIIQIGSWLFIK